MLARAASPSMPAPQNNSSIAGVSVTPTDDVGSPSPLDASRDRFLTGSQNNIQEAIRLHEAGGTHAESSLYYCVLRIIRSYATGTGITMATG